MKNKKIIGLLAAIGVVLSCGAKVDATMFYDTVGTRYEGAAERLGELGVINGVGAKTFNYNKTVTRAELAKMIVEISYTDDEIAFLVAENKDEYSFKDVKEDAWYYKYVSIAAKSGYIKGYQDGTFRPDKDVTYKEISKIVTRALGHKYLVETDPRGWAAEYLDKFYALKLNEGTSEFEENDPATRGNVAIILWNTFISPVWEEIYHNEYDGYTYVDSGRSLFNKLIKGYALNQETTIKEFREVNGQLYIRLGNAYYKLYDQEAVVTFSMLGGKAEALYKRMRYPENTYGYEVIGISTDLDTHLNAGTFEQLKEKGLSLAAETFRVSNNADYAYYHETSNGENNRMITVSGSNNFFYVEKVSVTTKDSKTIKDESDVIEKVKKENDPTYEYVPEIKTFTKNITINDDYEIADGAVLFRDNKRVDWKTLKAGEILTEIEKDKYYFASSQTVETNIQDIKMTENIVTLKTPMEDFESYKEATCLLYFADKVTTLNKVPERELIGKNVKLVLDFSGRVARVEIIENRDEDLLDLNIGFYKDAYYSSNPEEKECKLVLVSNKREKTFETALTHIPAEFGEILQIDFDKDNTKLVKTTKALKGNTKLTDVLTFKKESYENIEKILKYDKLAKNVLICSVIYNYDFGENEKISGFDVKNLSLEELKEIDPEKAEYYTIEDKDGRVRAIIVKDFSRKTEMFYGRVINVYSEKEKLRIHLDVIGVSKMDFEVEGFPNCEEGDLISFKLVDKNKIKTSEKFTIQSLGYYKDIIIKNIRYNGIDAENGEIYWDEERIVADNKEYDIAKFTILLVDIGKNEEGHTVITRAKDYKANELKLKENDRIAINEIEDTIIVYRGYKG